MRVDCQQWSWPVIAMLCSEQRAGESTMYSNRSRKWWVSCDLCVGYIIASHLCLCTWHYSDVILCHSYSRVWSRSYWKWLRVCAHSRMTWRPAKSVWSRLSTWTTSRNSLRSVVCLVYSVHVQYTSMVMFHVLHFCPPFLQCNSVRSSRILSHMESTRAKSLQVSFDNYVIT